MPVAKAIQAQQLARRALELTRAGLRPGQTLVDVRSACEAHLLRLGADSFWYWGIGAFVFAGRDTVRSVSGRDYVTPDYVLSDNELLTLDLSPELDGRWGDYARTLVLERGVPLIDPLEASDPEWQAGILVERLLHERLLEIARPAMTFSDLAETMNGEIEALGYENLDFRGNLGHSIAQSLDQRVYLESGNTARLDSVGSFTFEPHVRRVGGGFGYKREDIYRFRAGRLSIV
ncbi:M24 family metallopeptidase [Leucobacter aridicollis]|uniref:M24 family metallopeptidase n=1 Tax=Leucobacter aridicollis TaxID=283878 RepID=UPI0037CBD462